MCLLGNGLVNSVTYRLLRRLTGEFRGSARRGGFHRSGSATGVIRLFPYTQKVAPGITRVVIPGQGQQAQRQTFKRLFSLPAYVSAPAAYDQLGRETRNLETQQNP